MSQPTWTKVKATRATEICRQFDLPGEARLLLQDALTPGEFLDVLLARRHFPPAIAFLAHALPAREAVWWGCLCLRHAMPGPMPPKEEKACRAASQWVLEPMEEHRRQAKMSGEEAGVGTPAGALALAASWTGGSLAPDDQPVVPPSPAMPAKAVAGAVLLAATKAAPARIADTQRLFVHLGVDIAQGSVVWPEFKHKVPATA